jgi:hypothetical protein
MERNVQTAGDLTGVFNVTFLSRSVSAMMFDLSEAFFFASPDLHGHPCEAIPLFFK